MIRNVPVSKLKIRILDANEVPLADPFYEAQINPSSYKIDYNTCYSKEQEPGSEAARLRYNKQLPKVLSFKFLFDSTGSLGVETINIGGVQPDLDKFLKIVHNVNEESLEPNDLLLQWGALYYPCKLTKLSINYTKFDFRGNPCRATADCTFTKKKTKPVQAKKEKSETEGTKLQEVKEGDSLDDIAQKNGGGSAAYLGIARANKMKSLRGELGLPPASNLIIPPGL